MSEQRDLCTPVPLAGCGVLLKSGDYMPRGSEESIKVMLYTEQEDLGKTGAYCHFWVCLFSCPTVLTLGEEALSSI